MGSEANNPVAETQIILNKFIQLSTKYWDEQYKFNELFEEKISNFERCINNLSIEKRIKHLENLEVRLVKIEGHLKNNNTLWIVK